MSRPTRKLDVVTIQVTRRTAALGAPMLRALAQRSPSEDARLVLLEIAAELAGGVA